MAQIARSATPLIVVRGRSLSFPMKVRSPSGAAIDLTGSAVLARLRVVNRYSTLALAMTDVGGGDFTVSGPAAATRSLPARGAEVQVSITDPQGGTSDFVLPVEVQTL